MAAIYDVGYFNQVPRPYLRSDGTEAQYMGPARDWHGFDLVAYTLIRSLLVEAPPVTALDVGCGPGGFVRALLGQGIDARGVDFSPYAVNNPTRNVEGRLQCCDVTQQDLPGEPSDLVCAVDFLEHVYMADVITVVRRLADASRRWLFLLISTADRREYVWHATRGEEVPIERQWQAISGHVTCMPPQWWNERVANLPGWTPRHDLADRFEAWRTWHHEMRNVDGWRRDNVIIVERLQ